MTWILFLFAIGMVAWGWRCWSFAEQIRYLSDFPPSQDTAMPLVTVVVPFCNEEASIARVAEKLSALPYPNLEIIYVNDRSTDRGPALLQAYLDQPPTGAADQRIEHIKSLPPGWLGKVHALEKGLQSARGQWVLLMDADVMLEPSILRRAVNHCETSKLDHLALIAEFGSKSFWTASLQAAFFSLAPLAFLPHQVRDPKSNMYAGVGAFQLVRRSFLQRAGGLRWLALEVIDDIGVGKLVKSYQGSSELMSGKGLAKLHWYDSILGAGGMVRGTEKNVFAAMNYSFLNFCAQFFVMGIFMGAVVWSVISLVPYSLPIGLLFFGSLAVCAAGLQRYYKVWNFDSWHVASFGLVAPILAWMLARNCVLAWRTGGVHWRGSFYPLADLRANQRVLLLRDFIFGYPKQALPQLQSNLAGSDFEQAS